MKIVLDSNILFSALIKDSATRQLILKYENTFLFPSYIFNELEAHKDELVVKSKMGEREFDKLLELLLKKVLIVPDEALKAYREEAIEIVKGIDKDDAVFVACALAHPESVIWSDDKDLKKQKKIKIVSTTEMVTLLKN